MQAVAFRSLFACLLLLCVTSLAPSPARAQSPNYAAVEQWIDALLAELRRGGATRAERGTVSVDNSGGLAVNGVTVEWSNGMQVSLERVVGESVTTGARFAARRLRAEGVAVMVDAWRLETAGIELEGLDLPALAAADLLGRGSAGLAATIRELSLARASMPALTMRTSQGDSGLEATLREMTVTDVTRGIARRIGYGGASFAVRRSDGPPVVAVELGAIAVETADLSLEAEMLAPAANASSERRVAYARLTGAGASIDAGGTRFTLGPIEMVNVRGRPMRAGYLEMWRLTSQIEAQPGAAPSPEQTRRFLAMMEDALEVTEVERLTIGPSRMDAMGQVSIGRIEARNLAAARFASFVVSDVQMQSPRRERHTVGSIALRDVDYGRAFLALLEIGFEVQSGAQPDASRLESGLPRIGAIELRDLSVSVAHRTGPVQVVLDSLAFGMGQWRGFVPDRLRLDVSGLRLPAPLLRLGAALPSPGQLGIEAVDLGSQVELRIDAAARTATLRPGRIAASGLGAVVLELTIGDVDVGQLGLAGLSDPVRLLQQASFRELRLRVENAGIVQRVLAASQWSQDDLRQSLDAVALVLGTLIDDTAQRERAVAAFQAFERERRSLTLVVTPRERVSAMDALAPLAGGSLPAPLFGRINVTVSAND